MGLNILRDAITVILNLHVNARVIKPGLDCDFSLTTHRIDGIINQIRPYLIELTSISLNNRELGIVFTVYAHPSARPAMIGAGR